MTSLARLGLGTAAIAGLYEPLDEESAQDTMEAAWELGLRSFDTAPHYGAGLAERRLGRFLASKPRGQLALSTKVGRLLVPVDGGPDDVANADSEGFFGAPPVRRVFDFSMDGVLRSLEDSLERLGVDRIDRIYIHDPDDHVYQALTEAFPVLDRLRTEGVVDEIGVGTKDKEVPVRFVRETSIDVVMLAGRYTLLDQTGLKELLPACEERNVRVVAAGVFNSGVLANPVPGAHYEYSEAPPEIIRRAQLLRDTCADLGVNVLSAAMQFPLAHPAVSEVVVGARTRMEIEENVDYFRSDVPTRVWLALKECGLLDEGAPVPD